MDQKKLDEIILRYTSPSGRLLGILEEIQGSERYLPREALEYVSQKLDVPLSKLYSIATFYSFFNLKPVGEHVITVCMGTACHVRGAPRILGKLEELLEVKQGESTVDGKFMLTTKDRAFTINTARCFGACSMAPVVRVDGKIYGYNTPEKLPDILRQYGWRKE